MAQYALLPAHRAFYVNYSMPLQYIAHFMRVTGCRGEYKDTEPCIHIHNSVFFLTDSWNCLVFGGLHGLNAILLKRLR